MNMSSEPETEAEPQATNEVLQQEIELRAYFKYCERGCAAGVMWTTGWPRSRRFSWSALLSHPRQRPRCLIRPVSEAETAYRTAQREGKPNCRVAAALGEGARNFMKRRAAVRTSGVPFGTASERPSMYGPER